MGQRQGHSIHRRSYSFLPGDEAPSPRVEAISRLSERHLARSTASRHRYPVDESSLARTLSRSCARSGRVDTCDELEKSLRQPLGRLHGDVVTDAIQLD